ncbi:MAG: hypothetical protein KGJ86_05215 [Chloroflexota bacterium]|nr:hypothetical protein [Chloroflexota bacterium]
MDAHQSDAPVSPELWKECRDAIRQRLGLVSLAIWLAGMFWLMLTVQDADVYAVGGQASVLFLLPAAAPWLAYRWLVRREVRHRSSR